MNLWDVFGVAAVLSIRDYYRDLDYQKHKTAKFYQKCIEEISNDMSAAFELICGEFERVSPDNIPTEIVNGSTILGLYGCGLVLQVQPSISADQDRLLDIIFRCLSIPYSKEQFIYAVRSKSGVYSQFIDLIGITKENVGDFWLSLFKMFLKNSLNQKSLSAIMFRFSNIVMRFAILGHKDSEVAFPIIEEFYKSVDFQMSNLQPIVEDEIDFIGPMPYVSHLLNMKRLFDELMYDSHPETDGMEPGSFQELFEYMLLNNISNLIMACSMNPTQKVEMIDEVLLNLPFDFSMNATTFLTMKNTNHEFRALIDNTIITTKETLGKFWFFILIFGEKTARQEDCLKIAEEYISLMCGIEAGLAKLYPNAGFGRFAREQSLPIIEGMGKAYS